MGIRERQDRERVAVREAILTAARDLFVADGYGHTSIRRIAERIEYSPAAIYSYFPSKDDIFYALAEEGFVRLDRAVEAVAGHPDPIEDVRRCWWAFYQFSKEQREFFHLMFVDRTVPQITELWQGFAFLQQMLERVAARIQRAIDAGQLPATLDAQVALHILWATGMGPAVLGSTCRLAPDEDPDALARDVLETTLAGLGAGLPYSFVPCHPPVSGVAAAADSPGVRPHEG